MKKKITYSIKLPLCIIATLFVSIFIIWYFFNKNSASHYMHNYDADIDVQGNIYLLSNIETELREIIQKLENKAENIELYSAEYQFNSDKTGTVCFSFYFDRPSNSYSHFLERLTPQNSQGILELWVSFSDSKIYYVNYNYGYIKGVSKTPAPLENKDINILDYYNNLLKDTKYLTNVGGKPNFIKIQLVSDNISAISYSILDEKKILYTFP